MPISFGKPVYFLLLSLIPLFVVFYLYGLRPRSLREKSALAIRLLVLICLVIALAQPYQGLPSQETTVMYVVDVSESVSQEQLDEVRDFIVEANSTMEPEDQGGIVVFGANALLETPPSAGGSFSTFHSIPRRNYTNIEAGLELALANLPLRGNRRVVLFSDEEENMGLAARSALVFQEQGIPIDVYPLIREVGPETLVDQVILPPRVRRDQEFPVHVRVASSQEAIGVMRLYHNDRLIAEDAVTIAAGQTMFSYTQRLSTGGFHRYRVELDASPDTILANNQGAGFVIVQGRAPILLISDEESVRDSFVRALSGYDLDVEVRSVQAFPNTLRELQSYVAVVLDDIPAYNLSRGQIQLLQSYVREFGGGLVALAGRASFGVGEYVDTPLEAMLPVHSRIEQRILFPTLSLLLVIDRSGSMGEVQRDGRNLTKMHLAKEAAAAVVDLLVSEERIGVLAFDTRPQWIVPMQAADDKDRIMGQLAPLEPGGGTHIYPALQQAFEAMDNEKTAIRHLILLSDGISVDAPYQEIAQTILGSGITLSSVAIGEDVDLQLMDDLARWGGGELYHTVDMTEITQIFVSETNRIIRQAMSEESFYPIPIGDSVLSQQIEWDRVAPIHGFINTSARELADVHLITPDRAPLLASWRYGLGRTVSFLSDIGDEWLHDWIDTPEYAALMGQMVQYALPDDTLEPLFPRVYWEDGTATIIIDALDEQGNFLNFLSLSAGVSGPQGDLGRVNLRQTGPGEYKGSFPVSQVGTYSIHINWEWDEQERIMQTGLVVPYSPEYGLPEMDNDLLSRIAEVTTGRELTYPDEVFLLRDTFYHSSIPIWSWFVLAAILLFVLDVGIRIITGSSLMWPWVQLQRNLKQRRDARSEQIERVRKVEESVAKRKDLDQR